MTRTFLALVCLTSIAHAEPPPAEKAPETPTEAAPVVDPEQLLEQAARCLRRDDLPCAERLSTSLLSLEVAPELAREAASIALAAIAKSDRPDDAHEACLRLRKLWPTYSPPPDADPRIAKACAPKAPPPKPPRTGPRRFGLSIGGGLGLPLGASADRFGPGLHAAIDLRVALSPCWHLSTQATLALLKLDDALPVEPSQSTSLEAFTVTAGALYTLDLSAALELLIGAGLGVGGFGLASVGDGFGLALTANAGLRYALDPNLGLRLDFSPVLVVPIDSTLSAGGHLAFILRGEARF
jgi:hypothetical protein